MLQLVDHYCEVDEKKKVNGGIASSILHDYLGSDYKTIIEQVERLDLLKVTRYSRPKYSISRYDKGQCYRYELTSICLQGLLDTTREYVYKLLIDPQEQRKNQKRISRRGHNKLHYNDSRDSIKQSLHNIEIDIERVDLVVNTMTPESGYRTYRLIQQILTKDYDLRNNDSDNRVWTPYVQLPSSIRALIRIHGQVPTYTIDVRSCHPSLFGLYIKDTFKDLYNNELDKEVKKWNDLFLTPGIDPKDYLASLLNIKRDNIKEVMNSYFNGKRMRGKRNPFFIYDKWIQAEFPTMYRLWNTLDIKKTGNNISKYYETKLLLDSRIFKKAESLNITVGQEYDGFTMFGATAETSDQLLQYIETLSLELLGIQLVFKIQAIDNDTWDISALARKNTLEIIHNLKDSWRRYTRKTFRHKEQINWDSFNAHQIEYKNEMALYHKRLISK
jgi:hypothetical protein